MIHNEHLRNADELYEIRHNIKDEAIHVYIKDGNAIVFGTLNDLVQYVYFGKQVDRFYCLEEDLEFIYENTSYDFKFLKELYDFAMLSAMRTINKGESEPPSLENINDSIDAWSMLIRSGNAFKINSKYSAKAQDYINDGIIDENGNIQ